MLDAVSRVQPNGKLTSVFRSILLPLPVGSKSVARASIKVGLQLMADCKDMKGNQIPHRHFKNLATDNEDAETADVFMQLCFMGEIVLGR